MTHLRRQSEPVKLLAEFGEAGGDVLLRASLGAIDGRVVERVARQLDHLMTHGTVTLR